METNSNIERGAISCHNINLLNCPIANRCTVFRYMPNGDRIYVVQQRYNKEMKMFWWGPIDGDIALDIMENHYEQVQNEFAEKRKPEIFTTVFNSQIGNYNIITVRQLMWLLKMKPLPKEKWEVRF